MTAIPISVFAVLLPGDYYRQYWAVFKYVDGTSFVSSMVAITGLVLGCLLGKRLGGSCVRSSSVEELKASVRSHRRRLRLWSSITFWLTISGYICWFGAAIARGLSLDLITSVVWREQNALYTLKEYYFETIPGVTTATQFGV